MNISLRWLARYVDLDDRSPERILDDLTMSTAEVEGIVSYGRGLDELVVGHVVEHGRHPDAEKLSLNKVDVGHGELLSIVCGAPNVAAGQNVAVIKPGCRLPDGSKIKKSKIRGVESFGMICSERELGLSDEHDGILVLDAGQPPGGRLADALDVADHVLEIDNKSINHRPDLWGHYGIARELAAMWRRPLRPLEVATDLPAQGRALPIAIEDPDDCPRFTGVVIEGVGLRPSPAWLRYLLQAVGQRSIDLLVDLTNFVMLEVGQPMHAFDLARLDAAGVAVRRARPGETLVTLDEVERSLEPTDVVVTSGDRPVGLAGVMGGLESAVTADTSVLFLESANFRPARVRRTSQRLGLRTDASARFEKALDPAGAELGSRRFLRLLGELCPGARAAGPLVDPATWSYRPREIVLRRARLDLKLGHAVPDEQVEGFLSSLEFGVRATDSGWCVSVPSFRATKDITIEDDLIEEVGRMFRYDNIPEQPLRSTVEVPPREGELLLGREIVRLAATEMACHEVYSYTFTPDAVLEGAGDLELPHARVTNPVAPEITRIRRHVLPSLLGALADNLRRDRGGRYQEVRLVEHGKGYHPEQRDEQGLPREVREIALVWSRRRGEHPYARLRTHLQGLLRRLDRPAEGLELQSVEGLPWIHPGKTVALTRGGAVGYVGALHPAVCRALELPLTTAVANLDVRALLHSGRDGKTFTPIPRFPSLPVDVALVVGDDVRVHDAAQFLREAGKKLVRDVTLFEVYRGQGLAEGTKSLNFTVTLGAADRTLDARDTERFLDRVRKGAGGIGAELRG